jgi:hypothetical protein
MLLRAAFPLLRVVMRRAMSITAGDAFHSRAQTSAAMDRLERELGSDGYLGGRHLRASPYGRLRRLRQIVEVDLLQGVEQPVGRLQPVRAARDRVGNRDAGQAGRLGGGDAVG